MNTVLRLMNLSNLTRHEAGPYGTCAIPHARKYSPISECLPSVIERNGALCIDDPNQSDGRVVDMGVARAYRDLSTYLGDVNRVDYDLHSPAARNAAHEAARRLCSLADAYLLVAERKTKR